MKKKVKALNLVELVTVLVIMGALTATTFLALNLLLSRRLKSDVIRIGNNLKWARGKAIALHNDTCVSFSSSDYSIYKGDCSGELLRHGFFDVDIASPSTPFNITFNSFNATTPEIAGTMDSASSVSSVLTITLSHHGKTKDIEIYENTGYINATNE